ncbi:MAG: dihydroneopterin aldolase [Candidatus Rickettsiella isopodorum]
MNSQLILEKVNLLVKLGNSVEERQLPQKVSLQIKLGFDRLLDACTNDNLMNTICYANLADNLQQFCDDRSFKLIEALTYQLYQFLKIELSEKINDKKINVFLCITKNPQLSKLEQASFSISD